MHESSDENLNHINELLNIMQASCGGPKQSVFTKSALWMATKLLTFSNNIWIRLEFWLQNNHIPEMTEHAMVYLTEHPPVALLVGVFLLACGFPLLVYLIFAVVSAILTLLGFIIVEGIILAVATFVLVSVLMGMVGTAAVIAFICAGVYYAVQRLSSQLSFLIGTHSAADRRRTQPEPFVAPRPGRLRRGSAFFGSPTHAHQHDIFSFSQRGLHR
ncbi:uncharacterized protein LOC124172800 [Ischnura elegans]|uniref:uncharacterized protein LOC124172800 n=1 Tax=Ischnura elegans TaxID=197161 RepID=UPI001ED8A07C|nr:uncharacterized protein LOC124172800 [Ischnura elegans]